MMHRLPRLRLLYYFTLTAALLALAACSTAPSFADRRAGAERLVAQREWQATSIHAGTFDLVSYLPRQIEPQDSLAIYLEGDGLAWLASDIPSPDPTPRQPTGLQLALAHPSGNAVYLARPCQYIDAVASGCAKHYWLQGRFSPEVINAADLAISELKARFGARRLTLVGYSGGAAVAALVAVRRKDVERLVTVAGNLDHRAWTEYHRVSALTDSLNPADIRAELRQIRQWHFVGGRDGVVPPALVEAFAAGMDSARVISIADYGHQCCWVENWRQIWKKVQ